MDEGAWCLTPCSLEEIRGRVEQDAPPRKKDPMSSPEFYRTISFFPVVDRTVCTMCMECTRVCGLSAIGYVSGEGIVARKGLCRNCRKCVQACRAGAVSISAELKGSGLGCI